MLISDYVVLARFFSKVAVFVLIDLVFFDIFDVSCFEFFFAVFLYCIANGAKLCFVSVSL